MTTGMLSFGINPRSASATGENDVSSIVQRFVSQIVKWVKSQNARASDAVLVLDPDGLVLYMVGRTEAYDFALGGELSQFSLDLLDQGLGNLNTTLLTARTSEELSEIIDSSPWPVIRIPTE